MDVKRIYFKNQYNLKAQIACLEDGRYCLSRYSYPVPFSNNEMFDQRITDTITKAIEIINGIYRDDFAMWECSFDEFMQTFEPEEIEMDAKKAFEVGKIYGPADPSFPPIKVVKRTSCYVYIELIGLGGKVLGSWRMKIRQDDTGEYLSDSSMQPYQDLFTYRPEWELER